MSNKVKNIAIVGSGISGLTSAYLLSQKHHVTVFEKNDYIGGHTATVDVNYEGEQHTIDTGFIVFNNRTYPHFLKLLVNIAVGKQDTEMSFSVHNKQTQFEYNGHNLDTLFAQRRNLFKPKFWGLIREILRFNKACKALYQQDMSNDNRTLGDFLTELKFNHFFCEHYILPMGAAIWSSSVADMEAFELKFFIQFFHNHGLLNISDRPQWHVIPGGSKQYIEPLTQSFRDNIVLNANITGITRENDKVQLYFSDDSVQEFDELVLSCHSDQALSLLKDPTDDEVSVLGNIPYALNSVVLHTDTTLLPIRKKAWASWNYMLSNNRDRPASVTYNMNILQGIDSEHTFCVTLNQDKAIDESKIIRRFEYHHPVFNTQSMQAQKQRHLICGKNHTHFAGAYWYNGFHEDGVHSAVNVGERFGCSL